MAKAKTYEMEKRTSFNLTNKCELCENAPSYRAWYYPTFMNGDADWLGDFCQEHKGVDMTKLESKE